MIIEFSTVQKTIIALVGVLLFTTIFGFTMFLPAQKVDAGLPVADILGTAAQWAVHALGKVWEVARDGVKFIAQKAWDTLKISWEWIRENAIATLAAAALKIAAKFIIEQVDKLVKSRKIESFLYYADFLVRNVYAVEYITKNYDGDRENQLILAQMISEGQVLYNRINPQSNTYLAIKNKTLLNADCRTGNISPAAPDYYARVLESKSPSCIPSFVAASYRDAALTALGEAQDAAEQEIRSGQGSKSSRPCGTVVTQPTVDENVWTLVPGSDPRNPQYVHPTTGETINWLPTASSVICTLITYPAGHAANVINNMIDQAINLLTEPASGDNRTSAQLRSFLSNTMATMIFRIFQGSEGDAAPSFDPSGRYRLASTRVPEDFDFVNEVPDGIDADRRDGDVALGDFGLGGRDEKQLRQYWEEVCNERLPWIFALKNGNFPQLFTEINSTELRNNNRIHFGSNGQYFFVGTTERPPNSQPASGRPPVPGSPSPTAVASQLSGMTIEDILTTQIPFYSSDDDTVMVTRYNYVWQVFDRVGSIDPSLVTGTHTFAENLAHGRRYAMAINGFPLPIDIKQAQEWLPQVGGDMNYWPYLTDVSGKGYVFPPLGTIADGYNRITNGKLYTVAGGTTALQPGFLAGDVYDANGDILFFAVNNVTGEWEVWKLDKNVSVVISGNTISTNSNVKFLGQGGQANFIEFTDTDGKLKVLAAEKLSRQKPCAQEPFGPPANLQDIELKIHKTRDISLVFWNWIQRFIFVRDAESFF